MLFDTHTHLNFKAFREDADVVIAHALSDGMSLVIVGAQLSTSRRAVEMAERYPGKPVYATVGLHPLHLTEQDVDETTEDPLLKFHTAGELFDAARYRELARSSEKVVAIGETGLDYLYLPKKKAERQAAKESQKEVFLAHLTLADELGLPVIMHSRLAHKGIFEVFNAHPECAVVDGVAHGFTGTAAEMQQYLALGFYIGFNGIIFKQIQGIDFKDLIKAVPHDRFLLETDCPYLTPPAAGIERNEPRFVSYVVQEFARVRNVAPEAVVEQAARNAKTLFRV